MTSSDINKHKFFLTRILKDIYSDVELAPDMFAHKLCALLDRKQIANRDIFDSWYFMSRNTPINPEIVEKRMEMPLADYFQKCIDKLDSIGDKGLLNGLGELLDDDMKKFVRTKLRSETIQLMKFYKEFPIL